MGSKSETGHPGGFAYLFSVASDLAAALSRHTGPVIQFHCSSVTSNQVLTYPTIDSMKGMGYGYKS